MFAALASLKGAKGRLDLVGEADGAPIFVDYAHKPDALAKALEALRPYATRPSRRRVRRRRRSRRRQAADDGRDRRARRPTASSSPTTIRAARNPPPFAPRSWPPRRARSRSATAAKRSARAVAELRRGDVLLIAGKGHETGQIVGDQTLPFSDHDAVRCRAGGEVGMNERAVDRRRDGAGHGRRTRWRSAGCDYGTLDRQPQHLARRGLFRDQGRQPRRP